LIRSLDPDGVRHGVYGAARHGYFEASPNHDAICFRVVPDDQAERIYAKIASLPDLRPYGFILPNYPSYDDMYEKPEGLWAFGTWVNGGHWSTCEARMIMAYARLGKFEDGRRSMKQLLNFARRFRMDNPLVKFGSDVYQPREAINLTYDAFGPPAALIRGLFEYIYSADGLRLIPHNPPALTELRQRFPIRFGDKQIFLSTRGQGSVTGVRVNGRMWAGFDHQSLFLPYEALPEQSQVEIFLGNTTTAAAQEERALPLDDNAQLPPAPNEALEADLTPLISRRAWLQGFLSQLASSGLEARYETAHAQLALGAIQVIEARRARLRAGTLQPLPEPARVAADQLYVQTAMRLADGLRTVLSSYASSEDAEQRRISGLLQ
jgi:hypothetical protein